MTQMMIYLYILMKCLSICLSRQIIGRLWPSGDDDDSCQVRNDGGIMSQS